MNLKSAFLVTCSVFFMSSAGSALDVPQTLQGEDLVTGQAIEAKPGDKGMVVVFLSAKCPCSDSHVEEIKELSQKHIGYNFVAIHSNADEPKEMSRAYFEKAKLPFPLIQDRNAKLANTFKAVKTPHAFVMTASGNLVYRGGVSNSKDCHKADRKFLREALDDLAQGKKVRTPEGRTLGCAISRG